MRYTDEYELEETLLTYEECMTSKEKDKWRKAINEEKDSLKKNKTREIINKNDIPEEKANNKRRGPKK
jgi:hypothetical protein